jgi:hypothetical protein
MSASKSSISNGFARKSSAPASLAMRVFMCGEQDDRKVTGGLLAFELPTNHLSVYAGEPDIQQQQIRQWLSHLLHHAPIHLNLYRIPRVREHLPQHVSYSWIIIIGDEDSFTHAALSLLFVAGQVLIVVRMGR